MIEPTGRNKAVYTCTRWRAHPPAALTMQPGRAAFAASSSAREQSRAWATWSPEVDGGPPRGPTPIRNRKRATEPPQAAPPCPRIAPKARGRMDTHERNGTEADGGARVRTPAVLLLRPVSSVRGSVRPCARLDCRGREGSLSRRDGGDGDGAATDRAESHGVARRRTSAYLEVKFGWRRREWAARVEASKIWKRWRQV